MKISSSSAGAASSSKLIWLGLLFWWFSSPLGSSSVSSKLITGLSDEDKTAFVLKNGKPVAVLISHERYERLLKAGIDKTEN